jgi:DtxR family Mn-dependent transcriptional regulator
LTSRGEKLALSVLRKHRLWEVFLVDHLGFKWDEIHELAEQLEHIKSEKLVERLDAFLDHPQFDPHGDPIPDAEGNYAKMEEVCLDDSSEGAKGRIVSLNDSNSDFLQYMDTQDLQIGTKVAIEKIHGYDGSMNILVNGNKTITISQRVAKNININEA